MKFSLKKYVFKLHSKLFQWLSIAVILKNVQFDSIEYF